METQVQGPATVSFWYRVLSGSGYGDHLRFYVDGEQRFVDGGDIPWSNVQRTLGPGLHTLRWSYAKDANSSAGFDAAWVDQVQVSSTYSDWAAHYFTPAQLNNPLVGGFSADPDGDGLNNGLEATFGLNPMNTLPSQMPESTLDGIAPDQRLVMEFWMAELPPADLTYKVEVSNNLTTWMTIAQKSGSGPWSGAALVTEASPSDGRLLVRAYDVQPISASSQQRYMRFAVTKP